MNDFADKKCEDCGWWNSSGTPRCTFASWHPTTCMAKRGWKPRVEAMSDNEPSAEAMRAAKDIAHFFGIAFMPDVLRSFTVLEAVERSAKLIDAYKDAAVKAAVGRMEVDEVYMRTLEKIIERLIAELDRHKDEAIVLRGLLAEVMSYDRYQGYPHNLKARIDAMMTHTQDAALERKETR